MHIGHLNLRYAMTYLPPYYKYTHVYIAAATCTLLPHSTLSSLFLIFNFSNLYLFEISNFMASPTTTLDGRVAIITGASRGIGREVAVHLHSLGAKVVINYASSSVQADHLAAELNTNAVTVQANVADPDQVKLLFDRAEQEFGAQVNILVNCAGILDPKYPSLVNTTEEDWDSTFNVNTKGAFLTAKEAAKRIGRGGGGRIIMITTSLVGSLLPGYGAYTASKAAVEAMTKVLAKELKGSGITANCVAPGPVATELFYAGKSEEMINKFAQASPLGRLGQPKDVAQLVGFLATDAGEWINGQIVRVNGGLVI